jgi:hypothetical protein
MIRGFVLLCILLLAPARAAAQPASEGAWRRDVPCTAGPRPQMAVAAAPAAARVPGCVSARCTALPDGRRVCACLGDTLATVRMEAGGRTLHEWPADPSLANDPESLRVVTGDLDGDGRAETVVAELEAVSNGLGTRLYRVGIFDGRDPARPPVRLAVQDFDPDGSFVRRRAGGDCQLIATRWTPLLDARRGWGMYMVGQWMHYRDGRLEHDHERPVVARRLLSRFARTRWGAADAPFAHLRHASAEVRPDHEPASLPPLAGRGAGTIRAARGDTLEVALDSGGSVTYLQGTAWGPEHAPATAWLVDGATGRPYPEGYLPADPRPLEGTPVTVTTYAEGGEGGATVHLLGIHPPKP